MNISKTLNNQRQRLPVVAHPAEEKDHLWNEITLVANIVRLEE